MHGNVFDWTESGYGPYPAAPDGAPLRDPRGVAEAPTMVVRGGSVHWRIFGLHSAFRVDFPPSDRFADVGFRPVRAAERIPPR